MVLLVGKLGRSLKFPHRLDNNSHLTRGSEQALMASFQAFRSDVSRTLSQILLEAKPGSGFLSLAWVQKCLEQIPMIEKAFAKLTVDIDHPMNSWGESVSEAYLKYSLNVLELLNRISSSVSHLSQARLALSHGLSLVANSPSLAINHLQKIKPKDLGNGFKVEGIKESEANFACRKESIIHEALEIMISSGLRLFGIMLSGLCSDVKPYTEVRKSVGKLHDPSLKNLDSMIDEGIEQKPSVVMEVKEVNDAAAVLVAEIAPKKGDAGIAHKKGDAAAAILGRKLEVFEKTLQGIGKQTDRLFSEVLAARSKFLDKIRHKLQ